MTCPTVRIHPAILAQAAATTSLLLRWVLPRASAPARRSTSTSSATDGHRRAVRLEMLEEAVEIIRGLWTGDTVDHRGTSTRSRTLASSTARAAADRRLGVRPEAIAGRADR